jgi:dihydropyrimidinase
MEYDLVIKNATVVNADGSEKNDIAVKDGKIVALGKGLVGGRREIDATGMHALPGGVDSHCHIEQRSSTGLMTSDDFYSASVSAAFGGTTTIIPFAAQHRGDDLNAVVSDYRNRAEEKSVIDFAFHLIISDPSELAMNTQLPRLIEEGITSFKIYMTYASLKLDDYSILKVLDRARELQSLVMIHAENDDIIRWLTEKLLAGGYSEPKYHAVSHARLAEGEATHRAIVLAELIDTPMLIVHVSSSEAISHIVAARKKGLKIFGETCPQYLFLTADDLDRDGMDGAMYCCSPPPRDKAAQEAVWQALEDGTFDVFSSDHAPYRYDETGKLNAGPNPSFKNIANGVPGLEVRLPLLYSEGVRKGRLSCEQFVALTSTNHARLYGLYPRKGVIAVGADADIAIWDFDKPVTISTDILHDNVGYTPYEGYVLKGWPTTVINRGRVVVENEMLQVERGSGEFLACEKSPAAEPLQRLVAEVDQQSNFGAKIL